MEGLADRAQSRVDDNRAGFASVLLNRGLEEAQDILSEGTLENLLSFSEPLEILRDKLLDPNNGTFLHQVAPIFRQSARRVAVNMHPEIGLELLYAPHFVFSTWLLQQSGFDNVSSDVEKNLLLDLLTRTTRGQAIAPPPYQRQSVYTPLPVGKDSIRLLILWPGDSDPIKCSLHDAQLGGNTFTALSYVWGDMRSTKDINIDGVPFSVTHNLESALRHLRSSNEGPKVLWVDAICINQGDNVEKSQQVSIMGEIYKAAKSVIVWFGPESNSTQTAWGVFQDIASIMATAILQYDFVNRVRASSVKESYEYFKDIIMACGNYRNAMSNKDFVAILGALQSLPAFKARPQSILDALVNFFSRDWWTRIWIVQELCLAQRVEAKCGKLPAVPMDGIIFTFFAFFARIDTTFNSQTEIPTLWLNGMELVRHRDPNKWARVKRAGNVVIIWQGHRTSRKQSLFELLRRTLDLNCSDSRDKVYGVLSLAREGHEVYEALPPDYSLSPEDVYLKTALYIIRSTQRLDYLAYVAPSPLDVVQLSDRLLPSWIHDWRNSEIGDGVSEPGVTALQKERWPKADKGFPGHVSFDFVNHSRTLKASAVLLDNIHMVSDRRPGASERITRKDITIWAETFQELFEMSPDLKAKFWRLLLQDCEWPLPGDDQPQLFWEPLPLGRAIAGVCEMPPKDVDEENALVDYICSRDRSFQFLGYVQQIAITRSGLFLWASSPLRPGDAVFILQGCNKPLILRRMLSYYVLVGSCFVLDNMHGECFRMEPGRPEPHVEEILIA